MTYSIVAFDPEAQQMGVAVQSHHLAAGAHVIAAEAGVGVMAVQSYADRSYADTAMSLLRSGSPSEEVLSRLVTERERRSRRAQLLVLDHTGATAVYTGDRCVGIAGHSLGEKAITAANMVQSSNVWSQMLESFTANSGDLTSRMLVTLDVGEDAGGDWRGRQSAALKVVSTDSAVSVPVIDLRVDDSADPLAELRRLDELRRATDEMAGAFDEAAAGHLDNAVDTLDRVQEVYGAANREPLAWSAVLLLRAGRDSEAATRLEHVFSTEPGWRELIQRLPAAGLLPENPGLLEAVSDRSQLDHED
jgi:uncharacterized Ntn-hydrolase superfamily protein